MQTPNNILGVEYCKALCRQNSTIRPLTVKREGNAYHDNSLNGQFPSASAIRALWKSADCKMSDAAVSSCFPPAISALLSQTFSCPQFLDEEDFSPYLRWLLFSSDKAQLAAYQDVTPSFVQRLFHTRSSYESWGQYAALLKTRELTYSRICRMLMHCLLQISHVPALSYARLLGFRRQAAPVLSEFKNTVPFRSLQKQQMHLPCCPTKPQLFFQKCGDFKSLRDCLVRKISHHICA